MHVETTAIYRVLCHLLSLKHDRGLVEMTLGALRNLLVSASSELVYSFAHYTELTLIALEVGSGSEAEDVTEQCLYILEAVV